MTIWGLGAYLGGLFFGGRFALFLGGSAYCIVNSKAAGDGGAYGLCYRGHCEGVFVVRGVEWQIYWM